MDVPAAFNTARQAARYLAIGISSRRYLLLTMRLEAIDGAETSLKDDGPLIACRDQDPRIHALWLEEIAAIGGMSEMGAFIDENTLGFSRAPKRETTARQSSIGPSM